MSFESGRRYGRFWNDAIELNKLFRKHNFNNTSKNEREFEIGLANALDTLNDNFNCEIISQTNRRTTVKSVHCFGKNHRPDITLDENGIAIELKFIRGSGLKEAIGQGYLYRLKYRFVFLILVISESKKSFYEDLCSGKEKDLEDTLKHLAKKMKIFTYIVPAFEPRKGPGMKKCQAYFIDQ